MQEEAGGEQAGRPTVPLELPPLKRDVQWHLLNLLEN